MPGKRRLEQEDTEDTPMKTQVSVCQNVSGEIRQCSEVSQLPRLLESRSACLYEYLVKTLGKDKVFSTYLTVPIVLSFVEDGKFCQDFIQAESELFCIGIGLSATEQRKQAGTIQNIMRKLLDCNREWNRNLRDYGKIVRTVRAAAVYRNPFYDNTIQTLIFVKEVLGVIGKSNFQEGSEYYIDYEKGEIATIDKKRDKKCVSLSEQECKRDRDCSVRVTSKGGKACINSQRYRTIQPEQKSSYYVLENGYAEQKVIYKPLCLFHIISDNAGIFQQYDKDLTPTGEYTIVFPPFGGDTQSNIKAFWTFYWKGYLKTVPTNKGPDVGVQIGLLEYIDAWLDACWNVIDRIPKKAHIYVSGVSLGAALANIAAFRLADMGYKHVHMYAFGGPRVGDEAFRTYMESGILEKDSANYVRFNNVLKEKTFYTQFDPVCKFPINTWSTWSAVGMHLRYVDNPLMRCMGGGLTFSPVFETYSTQPDYDMLPFDQIRRMFLYDVNKDTPVGANCDNHWPTVHSVGSYETENFIGQRDFDIEENRTIVYTDFYDRIIDLSVEPCKKE